MADDDIVKVKRADLQALIDANVQAYNKLDEISTSAGDVVDGIKAAFSALEDVPTDVDALIVEEEEESS